MPAAALRYMDKSHHEEITEYIQRATSLHPAANATDHFRHQRLVLKKFLESTCEMELDSIRFAAWCKYRATMWEFVC